MVVTKQHEIRTEYLCLNAHEVGKPVLLNKCHGQMGHQKWVYNNEVGRNQYVLIQKLL